MKKTMIVFFLLILSFLLISCENVSSIEIRGITQLEVGYAEEYKIFENDSENNVNDYYWTTSNREVALCDNNKIMPLKEGNCEIVAVKKNNGEKYATLSISVIDSNIKKIVNSIYSSFLV